MDSVAAFYIAPSRAVLGVLLRVPGILGVVGVIRVLRVGLIDLDVGVAGGTGGVGAGGLVHDGPGDAVHRVLACGVGADDGGGHLDDAQLGALAGDRRGTGDGLTGGFARLLGLGAV